MCRNNTINRAKLAIIYVYITALRGIPAIHPLSCFRSLSQIRNKYNQESSRRLKKNRDEDFASTTHSVGCVALFFNRYLRVYLPRRWLQLYDMPLVHILVQEKLCNWCHWILRRFHHFLITASFNFFFKLNLKCLPLLHWNIRALKPYRCGELMTQGKSRIIRHVYIRIITMKYFKYDFNAT